MTQPRPGGTPGRSLVVEADGGSRGNPGPAAYGALVRDGATDRILVELAGYLGETTNNVAEYSGLLAGLEAAAEIAPGAPVECRLDSKLVVEQMTGRWAIRNAILRPLALRVQELAPSDRVTFTWVPRARNRRADALVNESLDAVAKGRPGTIKRWFDDTETDILADAAGLAGSDARAEAAGPPNRIVGWADLGTPTRLLAVRHGVTQHSMEHRFSGLAGIDPPLIELGQRQAAAVAEELAARGGADVIVSSPLTRARQTAGVIAKRLGMQRPKVDHDFAEARFGAWEGLTYQEVKARWPAELMAWLASPEVAPPGGESFAALRERVDRGRARVLAENPGRRVIIVSHVSPIKALVARVLEAPSVSAFRMELAPCSLTTLAWWADGGCTVYGFGESGHLHDVGHPTA